MANFIPLPSSPSYCLDHFEGTLELLLYLIQKEELDIFDIVLCHLIEQNRGDELNSQSEFLFLTSKLVLIKSQKLLPKEERGVEGNPELDFRLEIMNQLIEYYKFKEIGLKLGSAEEEASAYFTRDPVPFEKKRGTGLDEVSLDELKTLLQDLLSTASKREQKLIHTEEWDIPEKIAWFQAELPLREKIPFTEIFSLEKSKGELIVFFLALLELMKQQAAKLIKIESAIYITL